MGKPKAPKMPKPAAPVAIPEEAPETEDWAVRAARRKKGYTSTLLTGALTPTGGGKTTLG